MRKKVASYQLPVASKCRERSRAFTGNWQLATSNYSNGFTLIELMLSIALVLILMVGVNYVFKTTTDAVGAGQLTNTFSRDSQSTQALLFSDFQNVNKNPPCFIIGSQMVDQYLNAADAQTGSQTNSDPSQIVNYYTTSPPGSAPPVTAVTPGIYNYRCHRIDLLKFFVRGTYHRHSANDGSFTSSTTSDDAFITLGHALLPTNDASAFIGPVTDVAGGTTPHLDQLATSSNGLAGLWTPQLDQNAGPQQRLGAYASDWVLARSVMLLKDPNTNYAYKPGTTPPTVDAFAETNYPRYPYVDPVNSYPNNTVPFSATSPQYLIETPVFPYPFIANMTPLAYYTPDNQNQSANGKQSSATTVMQSSRFDLACVTPEIFRRAIADEILQWKAGTTTAGTTVDTIPPFTGGHVWWNPLVYSLAVNELVPANSQGFGAAPFAANTAAPQVSPPTIYSPMPYFVNPASTSLLPTPPQYQFGTYTNGTFTAFPNSATDTQYAPEFARMAVNQQIQTPLTSAMIAQMSPALLQHCSQFIVEYAGDYLQQDGPTSATPGQLTGQITGIGPDGQIDYVITTVPDTTSPTGYRQTKRIRWYGMPRSTNGGLPNLWHGDSTQGLQSSYTIRGYNFGNQGAHGDTSDETFIDPVTNLTHGIMEEFVDVVPLRDYYSLYYNTVGTVAGAANKGAVATTPYVYQPPWEVDVNFDPTMDYAGTGIYVPAAWAQSNGAVSNSFHLYNPNTSHDTPQLSARYVAAWYNDMPAMVRILLKVDDPNNKLTDGPWYEYVFKLK